MVHGAPQVRASGCEARLRRKRVLLDIMIIVGGSPVSSTMFCGRVAVEPAQGRSMSTASRCTARLDRSGRVELSCTTGSFKRFRQRRGAGDTSRARVDGFARVKKPSGICSGRLLHRSYLRGHGAKGSADVAAATSAPGERRLCKWTRGRGLQSYISRIPSHSLHHGECDGMLSSSQLPDVLAQRYTQVLKNP